MAFMFLLSSVCLGANSSTPEVSFNAGTKTLHRYHDLPSNTEGLWITRDYYSLSFIEPISFTTIGTTTASTTTGMAFLDIGTNTIYRGWDYSDNTRDVYELFATPYCGLGFAMRFLYYELGLSVNCTYNFGTLANMKNLSKSVEGGNYASQITGSWNEIICRLKADKRIYDKFLVYAGIDIDDMSLSGNYAGYSTPPSGSADFSETFGPFNAFFGLDYYFNSNEKLNIEEYMAVSKGFINGASISYCRPF